MRRWTLTAALVALAACSRSGSAEGDAPMRALATPEPTARYAHEFWLDQARRRTALWDSADAYCEAYRRRQDGSKPNCGHVYTANFHDAGARAPVRPSRTDSQPPASRP